MEVTCHCGNIHLKLAQLPKEVGECNCSTCRRYAAMWAYYTPDQVSVAYTKEKSKFYCWGDKDVEFHRYDICCCVTHYITTPKCDSRIFAVNMRMAENEVLSAIPVRKINGAVY
ncbi:aldehyde-activating protein [Vibrio cholerae]